MVQLFVRQGLNLSIAALHESVHVQLGSVPLPSSPGESEAYERRVHRVFAQAADVYFHNAVQAVHSRRDFVEQVVGAALSAPHITREGTRDVEVTLLGGTTHKVRTPYVLKRRTGRARRHGVRGKEGNGSYPVLRQLGYLNRTSPALVSEIGAGVATASVDETHQDFKRRGIKLDKKTIREVALELGAHGIRARDQLLKEATARPAQSGPARGLRLVVSTDGGKVKIRVGGKRGRRNAITGRRRYRTKWVEPRILLIYVIDETGKKVRHQVGVLDGKIAKADEVFSMLVAYLKLLGAHEAAELVIAADGAIWIWDRVDDLAKEVGIPRERITQVVDFYHATERLGEISKLHVSWPEADREQWLARVTRQLYKGKVDTVLEECRQLCRGCRSTEIRKLLAYFDRNRARMDYARFRKRGVPMGSGGVESAVRRVVNLRVKGSGIIWYQANADKVLHMRAQLKLGTWDTFVARALDVTAPIHTSLPICGGLQASM